MTPAELADWEAAEADSAAAAVADIDRLRADLDAFPNSRTLRRMAVVDYAGNVAGYTIGTDALAMAWRNGAPAALIVKAERLAATIGPRGSTGYLRRAVRLAHRVRALNAALGRYSGAARSLSTVTVSHPAPTGGLAAVLVDVDAGPSSTPADIASTLPPPSHLTPDTAARRGPPRLLVGLPSTSSRCRRHSITERPCAVSRVT